MFLKRENVKLLTLSTCWYKVKSKFPSTKYIKWIENFISIVNNFNLVIYTDKDGYVLFNELLKKYKSKLSNIKIIRNISIL